MNSISVVFNRIISVLVGFKFKDAMDIAITAFIMYSAIKLVRETRAGQLIKGIIFVIAVWLLAMTFNLYVVSTVMQYLLQFGLIIVVIVFQPEIRRALEQIGRGAQKGKMFQIFNYKNSIEEEKRLKLEKCYNIIVDACVSLSKSKTGALIVIERNTRLGEIINTGTIINAEPSVPLFENMFFNKAPLHDGAVIIRDGMIYSAGCILPLTKNQNLAFELGTRHRAGIGMSENSDAVVVIVSEETGQISIATDGVIVRDYTRETLKLKLYEFLLNEHTDKEQKHFFQSFKRRSK